jgi:hypothetical protein
MSDTVEVRSKSLQRYYNNRERYNEKAKEYFKSVWYVKNRELILQKQKIYRDSKRKKGYRDRGTRANKYQPKIVEPTHQNPSLIVSFE